MSHGWQLIGYSSDIANVDDHLPMSISGLVQADEDDGDEGFNTMFSITFNEIRYYKCK